MHKVLSLFKNMSCSLLRFCNPAWYGVHACLTLDAEQWVSDKIFIDYNGNHGNDNDECYKDQY